MGIARIPEDRHHDGVVGAMTVAENVALEEIREPAFQRGGFLRFGAIRARAVNAIRDYDVRCQGPDAPARLLSGGNIQKLILARVLDRKPRLILANQPTRGLDIGAQTEVQRRLLEAREARRRRAPHLGGPRRADDALRPHRGDVCRAALARRCPPRASTAARSA